MCDIDLLLQSIREIDDNIKQVRQQLSELYDYRRVLVDQVVRLASERGYDRGYTNGEYRYKVTISYRVLDPEAVERIAPEVVERQVVLKVDTRLAQSLEPYVHRETSHEVVPEERKSAKSVLSSRSAEVQS